MKNTHADIVIVGGGLVGLTFACLMAKHAQHIHIVDRASAPNTIDTNAPIFGRIHAYNLASQAVLTKIGVWSKIPQKYVAPFTCMTVTAAGNRPTLNIHADDIRHNLLGHFLPSPWVQHALYTHLLQQKNVTFGWQQTPKELQLYEHGLILSTNNQNIEGKIIVGADGGRSWLRDQTPISVNTLNYQQRCMVGFVDFEGSHQHTAWQRFLPTGPLGLLPLNDQCFSLAWTADNATVEAAMKLDEQTFLAQLFQQQLPKSITALNHIRQRKAFPLFAQLCNTYHHQRVVLIGDAAHAIHPLAGLGLNLGMKDACHLSQSLQRHGLQNLEHAFQSYTKQCRPHNLRVMHTMTALNGLFGQRSALARITQNALLSGANHLPWIKQAMGRYATHLDHSWLLQ